MAVSGHVICTIKCRIPHPRHAMESTQAKEDTAACDEQTRRPSSELRVKHRKTWNRYCRLRDGSEEERSNKNP